ncbi:hypothetical protein GIB67_040271 [Kingdonia uniflora]|uniref:Uncharacterized protein n=1 Tax=Kingdonia uniflora TaxID=39325 RepID=A0A7J7MVB3_9MAGN|nr:hypothetical protein GIB67_040271 [Kingdonia uniflora]
MGLLKEILAKEALAVYFMIVMVMCWVPSQKALGWSPISWQNARQSFMAWNLLLYLVRLLHGLNQTPQRQCKLSNQTIFFGSWDRLGKIQ